MDEVRNIYRGVAEKLANETDDDYKKREQEKHLDAVGRGKGGKGTGGWMANT